MIWIWLLMIIYILPGLIASHRRHRDASAILALNVFLGWTCLGWIIAFVWSLTGD